MIETIENYILAWATWLWGPPMLIVLSVIGVYFTIRLRGLQFTHFFKSAKLTFTSKKEAGEGNITPMQALYSALGGVIGNANIAGPATAIALGGPGAIFWMWIASFVGMVIVYAETLLAMKNRVKSTDGTFSGGPMYYIQKILKLKWLAVIFAVAMGSKTLLATATIQSNSISLAAKTATGIPMIAACIILAILTWLVIVGGIKSIARVLGKITPAMVAIYLTAGMIVIIFNISSLFEAFRLIFESAFTYKGASGGFAGASVMMALRYGVARGFYSNEAGTGSNPIMFSTAKTDSPVNQSLIGMFGVFIDTVVGTITGITILITGVWTTGLTSTALTTEAFADVFSGAGGYIMLVSSFLFGYSTLIAWCFYGEQCFAYVWGDRIKIFFRWAFCIAIIFGFIRVEALWSVGDLLNGFTILTNLVALVFLIKYVFRDSFNKPI
ncbi:MAG: sodium:alanine symporter family protein [bacterium]|nr:sodium:alanine symporter family protein [bacterium]